ncbi:hypothetical protein VIGAN_11076900 [Vigna angularis var. angularis]|uniref:3-beta hydroxysteroid dehydrogenase/isomerase domain-containing protein n=1 Tax=Vigna angularis var. angularis TaxID=157739 RepID=A0A0S3T8I6_PHAAN|nr:hypothetical protein VIGAN_11076900 [Vigna angularis var. angularis]
MGVMCTWESEKTEMEAFCRKLVVAAGKDDEGGRNHHLVSYYEDGDEKGTWLCVTSGVSYVGLALVNHLLQLGYSLRITVENPEEMEKVKEIEKTAEGKLEAIMAKLTDIDGLEKAFQGCGGVFHTSAFTDPAGLSGYTKSMAKIEVKSC